MLLQNEIQQAKKDRKCGGGCNFGLDGQHQASLLLYLNKEMKDVLIIKSINIMEKCLLHSF